MQIKSEIKNLKVSYKEKVEAQAVEAYTATSSAARLNVTLSMPALPASQLPAVPKTQVAIRKD